MHRPIRFPRRAVAATLLLAIGVGSLPIQAFADPPPWAPANGWRRHHEEQRYDNDEDRRGGAVVVQQSEAIQGGSCDRGLLAGSLSGSSNNIVGSLLGGAAGGLLGNQFGKGSGKAVTTLLGAVAGILAGGAIGRSMEPADQGCVGQALEHAPNQGTVAWRNPDNNAQYQVTPVRTYEAQGGQYCREYVTSAVIDGRNERVNGTACRQPDGTWRPQN